jgi:thiosulfate dehydrogenase [quinone] large subunit
MHETLLLRRWLSVLRIVTGGIFVYVGTMHVVGGWATPEVFSRVVGQMAAASPFGWYTATIGGLVLSAPSVFGPLFAFGMVATGLGLVFGALTRVAIVAGLWLNLNNVLIGFSGGPVHHGVNLLMVAVLLAVWQTGGWRWYSLDGLLGGDGSRSAATTRADARV